ncbi:MULTISPECIES: HAMP domain-containing sensor histidine kinase [unclassified Pseudomonas]|uniref:sensor histidine kinase n=1 Tax=unclassified Pseudomonas TaxID=196821 RepID=UPI001EE116D3|nr:HAMP domain-containing sensor histidine kinase [Pseudomonas sp.]MCG4451912.1 HAMP domain-containing histidine kinase [Pseudomonas sp. MMS21 TM103]
MVSKQPLLRRIVIAFVLMTLVVSGVFSLSIVAIVHFVEEHLVSQELDRELSIVIDEDLRRGQRPRLDSSTRFFASHLPEFEVPLQFAEAADGFSEVVEGDQAFYLFKRSENGRDFMLVQEQHEFEAREQVLFNVVLAGFLLSMLVAWSLGWLLARRVMAPVIRLANQVRHRDQLHALAPALAPDYPDDEVGHLAAAFDSTLGQLRHSLERERLFTSDVSHELRTPLMIIASSCELLAEAPNLDARQLEQIQRIARATEEMGDLVQTFLILARARPQESSQGGSATLAAVADEQSKRWAPLMHEKGLQFQLIEEGEDDSHYNLTFLRTVISNLLRNALHYTEQGTVRLILQDGGFRVEDSGVGIPLDQQEQMFQPFVRGAQSRGEGLGLGLSLVKRICTHQGWTVQMRDLPPRGSAFEVSLRR